MRELLAVFESKWNDLVFSLYRTRQTAISIQRRIGKDAAMPGRVGLSLS